MSAGDIAGLVVAIAGAIFLLSLTIPVLKLARILSAIEDDVVKGKIVPILGEAQTSVAHVNVNLENAESLTTNARDISSNAKALSGIFAATLGSPMVKVAAFSYGVRRAASRREKADITREVRATRRARKKAGA
jgi:hypothetical protein